MALEIVVVASPHRPPIVTAALQAQPHAVVLAPDETLPPGFTPVPEARALYVKSHLGAFRCYRGHQLALSQARADHVLVLEDDAAPNRADWMTVVERGRRLLGDFEVVSLHGRDIRGIEREIAVDGTRFVTLVPVTRRRLLYRARVRWVQGSLAYLITAAAARRIVDTPYRGLPLDHVLANDLAFAVATESPFDHDRRHGSLVERPR